jgi:hypothetical protein
MEWKIWKQPCKILLFVDTILVIFNFCRFGNLQSYLINNRDKFINQLNGVVNIPPDSNKMDTTPAK